MAGNFSFLTKRFLVFTFLGVLILIFAAVFFFQEKSVPLQLQQPLTQSEAADTIAPVTVIISPDDNSWHNSGFYVEIQDGDLGSGLVDFVQGEQGCRYAIEDLGTREARDGFRPCKEARLFFSVGSGNICSSSFEAQSGSGRCMVSVQSVDKAGNESKWESRIFLIDIEPPIVGLISSLPDVVLPQEIYTLKARVSDNARVAGCSLLLNNQKYQSNVSLTPIPCEGRKECELSATITFLDPGEYEVSFACFDIAENVGSGEPFAFEVFVNKAPIISLCRVTPTVGTGNTEFQFFVEAMDPNQDSLSFVWEFGDGVTSVEQMPSYNYKKAGTFMPRVFVRDPQGEEVSCSTAWVVQE